ncbi:MAG: hypothetical protein JRF40_08955 [Deltaproteobacteria bacterium]|nr:hypothetical protein [Deltaproteobacteria bacterium]MBW2219601.1 hypothetical protein [Deltaproteobacteria bacterium]
MNFYEDEKFERVIEKITDEMGYLIMDIILMDLKKTNTENQIFEEILDAKLEAHKENHPEI